MEMWIVWAVIALLAILVELFTFGFAVVCFALGALMASLAAYFGAAMIWQLALFSLFSLIALIVVRPISLRYLNRKREGRGAVTNLQAVVGRRAVVSEAISGGEGRVTLDGDSWKAECEDASVVVEVGERVEVVRVEGLILIIKKL